MKYLMSTKGSLSYGRNIYKVKIHTYPSKETCNIQTVNGLMCNTSHTVNNESM